MRLTSSEVVLRASSLRGSFAALAALAPCRRSPTRCGVPVADAGLGRLRRPRRADPGEAGDRDRRRLRHRRRRRRCATAGAATVLFDLNFNKRVGTTSEPGRPVADRRAREVVLRLRRLGHRLPDADDRRERARRRADADAVDAEQRAVPRERPAVPDRPDEPRARRRCSRSRTRRTPAATTRRTGGSRSRRSRSSSARSTSPRRTRSASTRSARRRRAVSMRQSLRGLVNHLTQIGIPSGRVALEMQFTTSPGLGQRAGLEPAAVLARDREARGARGEVRRDAVQAAGRLVVGLGDLQRERHSRPRQGRGRVRLALGARPDALRRRRPPPAPASTPRSPRGSSTCRPARAASRARGRSRATPSAGFTTLTGDPGYAASVLLEQLHALQGRAAGRLPETCCRPSAP